MKRLTAIACLSLFLSANASAGNTCNTLIAATEGDEISLKTYEIEVKKDGVTVMKEKKNMFNTDSLECGKSHTVYVRLMDGNKILKTRTRTFFVIKSNKIKVNMED